MIKSCSTTSALYLAPRRSSNPFRQRSSVHIKHFQGSVDFGMKHKRIPPRTPNMNGHIESFHRILQDDCLSKYEFQTYGEAYQVVSGFIRFYNERRIHSNIRDMAPEKFYSQNPVEAIPKRFT